MQLSNFTAAANGIAFLLALEAEAPELVVPRDAPKGNARHATLVELIGGRDLCDRDDV